MKTKYPRMFGILAALMLVASFVVPTSLVSPSAVQADPGLCKWDNLAEPGAAYGLWNIAANEIIDWAIASDGTNMAAIVKIPHASLGSVNILLKSPAYTGLFWTGGSYSALGRKTGWLIPLGGTTYVPRTLYQVVFAPDNPNIFAVTSDGSAAADFHAGPKEVWITQNGGADWEITNFQLATGAAGTIRSIDISIDYGGRRDIAVGMTNGGAGSLWIVKSTGFTGWQKQTGASTPTADYVAVKFSPSYPSDASLAVVFADGVGTYYNIALRDLDANAISGWAFTLKGVEVVDPTLANTGASPMWFELNEVNLELPSDFSGQAASLRRAYISLDTYNCGLVKPAWDGIVRMDNNTVYVLMDTSTLVDKSIYSIAYFGTYASGKLLAGDRMGYPCEATVPTYFTDSPTTCPIPCWYECLKCTTGAACYAGGCNCPATGPGYPTCAVGVKNGVGAALVIWRPNGQLAFVGTGSLASDNGTDWYRCWATGTVTPCDESAFAISRNNGETWNQVSLIDTNITKFTDIAPSADCKTIYLASVNTGCASSGLVCTQSIGIWCDNTTPTAPVFRYYLMSSANCSACSFFPTFNPVITGYYDQILCDCVYTISGNWTYACAVPGGCLQTTVGAPVTGSLDCGSTANITYTASCSCAACGPPVASCCEFDSVWRTSSNADVVAPIANLAVGTLWERVFTHVTALNCTALQTNVALLRLVPWCADLTGEIVGWGAWNTKAAFWSPDYGDYWAPITLRNNIQDFTFDSRTMLYFLSSTGLVQKMPYTGTAWSTSLPNYDSGVNPAHTIASMPEGKVLVGKGEGAPYAASISLNADSDNPTFVPQFSAGALSGGNVHVAFDPKFDDNSIYYIAQEGLTGSVYRNTPTSPLRWQDTDMMIASNGAFGCPPGLGRLGFSGIILAYTGEALYASSQIAGAGVWRTIDDGTGRHGPLSTMPKPGIAWDQVNVGIPAAVVFTAQPSALRACGCCELESDLTLYALDNRTYEQPPYGVAGRIWAFTDCLAKRGPTLVTDNAVLIGCDPVTGRALEVNLCWNVLCVSSAYDVEISKNADFSILVIDWIPEGAYCGPFVSPADPTTPCVFIPAGGTFAYNSNSEVAQTFSGLLECGHTYYWRVRARGCGTAQTIRSPWSEARSFTVKAGLPVVASYSGLQLLSPANGMIGLPVKSPSFSWAPLGENTKYKFILAKDGNMTQIVKEAEVTNTAYAYDGTLDYDTAYFWKVQCVEPACDASATFSFRTESAPPAAEEEAKAPPTPFWVWVVIAIGAILVIVTLVLIFKTRRV